MSNTDDKALVAPKSTIQRYGLSCFGDIIGEDGGRFVKYADHLAALEAAKLEGIRIGLEAAAKACGKKLIQDFGGFKITGPVPACADAIRSLPIEQILKGE